MGHSSVKNQPKLGDPTAAEALRALLDDTLVSPAVQALMNDLNARNICLVLSGGGGKGAYQAGAILALHDCGIKNFLSIAGTSVGGLNAALCHELYRLGDRDLVLKVWGKITYRSVLALSFGLLAKLVLYALQSVRIFKNTESFLDKTAALGDVDVELDSLPDFLKRLALTMLSVCLIGLVGATTVFFFFFVAGPFLINALGLTLLYGNAIAWILSIVVMSILPRVANFIGRRFALFSNAPLRRTIEKLDIDAICDGKPPIICTLAERLLPWIQGTLVAPNMYRPYYVPLHTLQRQQAVDVLLQTAAIPEIFRARKLFGRYFVDGGMTDNTPILGVLQQRPDTLLVVYLDHRFARIKDLFLWERLRLRSIISTLGGDEDDEAMQWVRTINLIAIIPTKPLGDLFSGTLNFGTAKAQKLIALGYEDTLRQLTKVAKVAAA